MMAKETPEQQQPAADTAVTIDEPLKSPSHGMDEDLAPDLEVAPEDPAEDQEDVERMWEASDPVEGEAPTG